MGMVGITKTIMIVTRATTITFISSIDMTTVIMMLTGAMATLPTENNDVDCNVEDAYANDVDHSDDNS